MIQETYIRFKPYGSPYPKTSGELIKVHKLDTGVLVEESVTMKSSMHIISQEEFDKLEVLTLETNVG